MLETPANADFNTFYLSLNDDSIIKGNVIRNNS